MSSGCDRIDDADVLSKILRWDVSNLQYSELCLYDLAITPSWDTYSIPEIIVVIF